MTSFAERATIGQVKEGKTWLGTNSYKILILCYQVGVMFSRSSLVCIKLSRRGIGIVTVLQFINFLVFFSIAVSKSAGVILMSVLMFWSGCMGGMSFVNCFYQIMHTDKLEKKEREIAINLANFMLELGIAAASVVALLVSNFVLKG